MNPLCFAWRILIRQPMRALLGVAGIAVVGALLFDMLLLSGGLELSIRELLDTTGFDLRVSSTDALPGMGHSIEDAAQTMEELRTLREIDEVVPLCFGRADVFLVGDQEMRVTLLGTSARPRNNWRILEGEDLPLGRRTGLPSILINQNVADRLEVSPGDVLSVRGRCTSDPAALPPVRFKVAGIAELLFQATDELATATTLDEYFRVCGDPRSDAVDLLLVASRPEAGTLAALEAIRGARPDLYSYTNEQLVQRLQQRDFSYFKQVSVALTAITLFFAFLLLASLLTVSVNQRLGEVAGLRALGFPRRRVVADLICESVLLVAAGGVISLPVGGVVAVWLDTILRGMPGLPQNLHFFVFQARALVLHGGLLLATGLLAALYPVYLAARLPIAPTLRKEVVS